MRNWSWLISAVAWDGLLPIVVGIIPLLIGLFAPGDHVLAFFTCGLLPMFAAFVRAAMAHRQLQRVCHGRMPVIRQFLIALAIISLMVTEAIIAMMAMAPKNERVPIEVWWTLAASYLLYLLCIVTALRPMTLTPVVDPHRREDDLDAST
jgi:hypothetical protein